MNILDGSLAGGCLFVVRRSRLLKYRSYFLHQWALGNHKVARLVRIQLRTIGLRALRYRRQRRGRDGSPTRPSGRSRGGVQLAALRKCAGHTHVRPAGVHSLSVLDDLSEEGIDRMNAEGFEPKVVVEMSPSNCAPRFMAKSSTRASAHAYPLLHEIPIVFSKVSG